MKYKLTSFSILEYGQRKDAQGNPHQEDSLFPVHNQLSDDDRLFIVCDGMGGHDFGEVASATVCEAMSKAILEKTSETDFTDDILKEAIQQAYDALDARDTGSAKKMGTTMTVLKLHQQGATIAHIGDSRVYHIRPGKDAETTRILHVTKDHSLLNSLLDVGELTPEDIPNFKQKNVITRAMGADATVKCDTFLETLKPGQFLLLCSDGLIREVTEPEIYYEIYQAEHPETACARLLDMAKSRGGRDNITMILIAY